MVRSGFALRAGIRGSKPGRCRRVGVGAFSRSVVACAGMLMMLALLGTPGRAAPAPQASRLDELLAVDQKLYELATAQPARTSVHAWSLRADRLVAYVDSADQARAELSRVGVDLGKIEFAPAREHHFKPLVCTPADCVEEPMRGGLSWFSARGQCTTGFGATRNGEDGFLSAGHCAPTGADVFIGDPIGDPPEDATFYGTVERSVRRFDTDALFAEKAASYPSESRGWIYLSSAEPRHEITSREPRSGYEEGSRSCIAGFFSGFKCGQILDGSYTDVLNGLRDVVLVDDGMCGVPGDSGAPVFDDSKAMGIFTGALVSVFDPAERCQEAVYVKLFRVEDATGAEIITE